MRQPSLFWKVALATSSIIIVAAGMGEFIIRRLFQPRLAEGIFASLVIGLTVGLNYLLLRLAFRSLFSIQRTIDEIRRGNLAARAPEDPRDPEVHRLAAAFNVMLDQLKAHAQTIARDKEQIERLTAQVIRAQEEERRRIARELHDESGQALTALIIALDIAEQRAGELDSQLKESLAEVRRIAGGVLQSLHDLALDLRSPILDNLGLVPAIRALVNGCSKDSRTRFDLLIKDLPPLPPETQVALYRVVQEAISNIRRHAHAQSATIELAARCDALVLIITDDGRGFDLKEVMDVSQGAGRLGLFGMQERVAMSGGTLQIESKPGQGTTIKVTVPLKERGVGSSQR
ncbi:MAG: HAMP domain-containing sensor histidine kinase [Bacillota bacterium]